MKQGKKRYNIKGIIIAVVLVALVLYYFNYLSNQSSKRKTESEKAELEQLMEYNMSLDYPNTPRDVAKLHNRYFKLFYGQSLSDDELVVLNEKVRTLYSAELLAINEEITNLNGLKQNIKDMNEQGYVYKSYILPEASQVQYFTRDGREMASLEVAMTIGTKDGIAYRDVRYILIKENDQWKIYGWGDVQTNTDLDQ